MRSWLQNKSIKRLSERLDWRSDNLSEVLLLYHRHSSLLWPGAVNLWWPIPGTDILLPVETGTNTLFKTLITFSNDLLYSYKHLNAKEFTLIAIDKEH